MHIFCQAAEGQQCIFCCQASALGISTFQNAQIWAFSVGYQQYTTYLTPLNQNCGLEVSAYRRTQCIERFRWWTGHYKITHRKGLSLQEHLGTLWTSERQLRIRLNHAGSAAKTMKWIKKVLWGSSGILIYYIHFKPLMFILHTALTWQKTVWTYFYTKCPHSYKFH